MWRSQLAVATCAAVAPLLVSLTSAVPAPQCEDSADTSLTCSTEPRHSRRIAQALAAETADADVPQVQLLQLAAAHGGQDQATASRQEHDHKADVTAAAKARASSEAARTNSSHADISRTNTSREGSKCHKLTGGTCMVTGECSASRSATCSSAKLCVCPDYTCAKEGKCELSTEQIAEAVHNGVSGVAEQVTSIAGAVPGIADSVGGIFNAVAGVADTIGGFVGSLAGDNQDACSSRYVGTCLWSDCDSSLGLTVSCQYGSCQCKPGFCAVNGACMIDLKTLLQD
mmetsp:Transcript_69306/g.224024  ORF Transcript_69306/g.224024 Transcript_69306/m.224024 type:complete len:286 (+) Transcript_69306:83-940(+)